MECSAFKWDHSRYSPYNDGDFAHMVSKASQIVGSKANTTAMCTTVCWTDRLRSIKITAVHNRWMTSVSSFVQMNKRHSSPKAMALEAMHSMKIACSKSGSQSDVGASTRRSRIGSSRILLDRTGVPIENAGLTTRVCLDPVIMSVRKQLGWFGNPTIRAVSKLCSSVMQLTLKVKSSGGVENLSPTLALMSGAKSWLVIDKGGRMDIHGMDTHYDVQEGDTVCSLYKISQSRQGFKRGLVERFIDVVCTECNALLDSAERACLVLLLELLVRQPMEDNMGIQTVIGRDYKEFSSFAVFNASFVDSKFSHTYADYKRPSTVAEYMLLRQFSSIPSIL